MKTLDVVGVCNALVDILVQVEETDLKHLSLKKGIMHLVDEDRQQVVLKYLGAKPRTIELGGSCLNAVRTLASLGRKCGFAGMISRDDFGERIAARMRQLNIEAHLSETKEGTGSCVILITPDGERTMNTHLGASRLYTEEHIPHGAIAKAKVLHFSGYQWDTDGQKRGVLGAIKTARENATLISFDVSDPFVVERHRDDFARLIKDEADLVFANRDEAKLLFGTTPEAAGRQIAATGAVAVIKLGAEGAVIFRGPDEFRIAPVPTQVVDTTAAGDMFAAGFLHGFSANRDLPTCGKMAAMLASDVISRIGASVSDRALADVSQF